MKTLHSFLFATLISCISIFSSCSSDDDDNNGTSSDLYKIEVNFGEGAENYLKQVSITGSSDSNIVSIKDGSGKELTTGSLTDSNYTFASKNTFELTEKASTLALGVSVSHHGTTQHDAVSVSVKIYKGGKLIYEDEGTATSTKSYQLIKSYY